MPVLVPDRRKLCRVIFRQVPGLDPAAGFLVFVVVPVGFGVAVLVVLFFARGSVPWPRCLPSSSCPWWSLPMRIAAGVVVVPGQVVLVLRERAGRPCGSICAGLGARSPEPVPVFS